MAPLKRAILFWAFFSLTLFSADRGAFGRLLAQEPQNVKDEKSLSLPSDAIKVEVNLVNVLCTVVDKNNRFVTNLSKDHFRILEDGKPQEIRNFSRETNLPLIIALLIDTSESVLPKLKFEQEAAINFFQSVLREQDRALLVEFDSGVTLLQDYTNDPNRLARQIRTLRAGGGTSLYDAIYLVSEQKLLSEKGRKTIIVISDGADTTSKYSFEEALEMAQRAEATIFCISTNKILEKFTSLTKPLARLFEAAFSHTELILPVAAKNKTGDRILMQFAEETGGRAFFPIKSEELDIAFQQINEELRSQYALGYVSSNPARDGSYRSIMVTVTDKNLRVRHRKGYYAPLG